MKKFFTLIAVALFSLSVSAEKAPVTIGETTLPLEWSAGAWGGNWWGQNGFDASAYDYLWIEYKACVGSPQFGINYGNWLGNDPGYDTWTGATKRLDASAEGEEEKTMILEIKIDKESLLETAKGEDATAVEHPLKGQTVDHCVQDVFLQATGDGQSVTVLGIYWGSEADLSAAKAAAGIVEKKLADEPTNEVENEDTWAGEYANGSNSNDAWSHYWVHEWRDMSAQTDAAANWDDAAGAWKVYVRSVDEAIAAGNMVMPQGATDNTDPANFADWDSQFFIAWEKGLEKGEKVMIFFSYKSDAAGNGVQVGSQTHALPGEYIDWQGVGSITFGTDWDDFQTDEFEAGSGNVPAGCRCIAFNLAKGAGYTAYFKDIEVWITRYITDGISEVYKQTPDGKIVHRTYNMAGQLVSEDYKGLVIKNGKKYIQK
jgi:hypothetical protein